MTSKMKKILSMLLILAMVIALLPGMGMAEGATWNSDLKFDADTTIADGVTLTANMKATIAKGVTVTVKGGIYSETNKTLTVTGEGKMVITGAAGSDGFSGKLVVDGPTVTVTGGRGAPGVAGTIEVKSGKITVTSGYGAGKDSAAVFGIVTVNGGTTVIKGGGSDNFNGCVGVHGVVIVNGGSATVTGGSGGTYGGYGGPGIKKMTQSDITTGCSP